MVGQGAGRARLEGQIAAVGGTGVEGVDGRQEGVGVFTGAGGSLEVGDDVGGVLGPEGLEKAEQLGGLGEAIGTGGVEAGGEGRAESEGGMLDGGGEER